MSIVMSESAEENVAQLSQGAWIDQVADRFDAAWQGGGEMPRISDFLSNCEGVLRRDLIAELVAIDREYRTKRGVTKSWGEYISEFPELAAVDRTGAVTGDTTHAHVAAHASPIGGQAERGSRSPDDRPADPEQVGKYRVLKRLGGGGQATAYLAFDPDLSKSVVIKLSHDAPLLRNEDEMRTEGRVLADLSHRNLVRVSHYDLFEGRPYLVMEHIAGQNLAQWATGTRPSPRAAALLVAKVAEALASAHRRGVVHRDIKPANVLIDESGEPRVIDFGLAWHRHGWDEIGESDSSVAGTVAYIPPEQARGELERVGPRSDIFGLGGILYFLLTGQSLFMLPGERDFERVLARAKKCSYDKSLLTKSGAPLELQQICLKAIALEPEDRHATAGQLAKELRAAAGQGQLARRVALGGLLAAAGGVALGVYSATRPKPLPVVTPPALFLRVWRDGQALRDWVSAAPLLGDQDELQIRWTLPEGLALKLYMINGRGKLIPLDAPVQSGGEQIYPKEQERFALTGDMGTEGILLCAFAPGSNVPAPPWDEGKPWPALALGTVLRMTPSGIESLQRSRDPGLVSTFDDPDEVIRQRLEALRKRLPTDYHYFEAIAIGHQ